MKHSSQYWTIECLFWGWVYCTYLFPKTKRGPALCRTSLINSKNYSTVNAVQ